VAEALPCNLISGFTVQPVLIVPCRRYSDDKDGVAEALRELLQQLGLQVSPALCCMRRNCIQSSLRICRRRRRVSTAASAVAAFGSARSHPCLLFQPLPAGPAPLRGRRVQRRFIRSPRHCNVTNSPTLYSQPSLQDLPLYVGGVSSGGSFALKLNKEMAGEIKGAFSEVLSMDPDNDDGTDVSTDWFCFLCVL